MTSIMISAIVFLPLLGALLAGLGCRILSPSAARFITSSFLCISAILSGIVFYDVVIQANPFTATLFRWFDIGTFSFSWAFKVDALTAVMLIVVTSVSSLVHIYSIGYMSHDPHVQRFMAYLSLFTFFMLMLVTADNLVQLFLGWEGVGLCSYLLIGFWFTKPSANAAAMKAFIVNRVGDFGFALGIFAIFLVFDSVTFTDIFAAAKQHETATISILGVDYHALTVICILLFIGSMGKSAQLGLHTWLPDAMEGPTPVSALIHAATMVTAGVFLVARCSPLFELAPLALSLVTVVGAVTCLFAASIALTQNDIKKIIAYSTCSQLGYMFFACGVSAYEAGVFHLLTHAFFKALLFLGAGSVIHAMSDEQDIRKMGGIWKKIPWTYTMMWIGSLALVGIFPLAGFYSKDMILESAYASGTSVGQFAYWMGITAAFCTAFYSWRLIIMAFHGTPKASKEVMSHVHESPPSMMIPLILLSVGALFSGIVGYHVLGIVDAENAFWGEAIFHAVTGDAHILEKAHHVPAWVKFLPLVVGVAGISLAYLFYMFAPKLPETLSKSFSPVYKFLLNKWYVDELYNVLFVIPTKMLGSFLWKVADVLLIDGCGPRGAAWFSRVMAAGVSRVQTGYVYHYAFVMLIGVIGFISWYVLSAYYNG